MDIKIKMAHDLRWKLKKDPRWSGYSQKFLDNKTDGQETFHTHELTPFVNNKKVKFWLQIRSADDAIGDEYIPMFKQNKTLRKLSPKQIHIHIH